MTAKGTTKQGILDAALELFSVQGYEATSISQLAEAVGIRKASLYSHFENKQAILDALIQTTIGEYEKHSIFANADWDDPAYQAELHGCHGLLHRACAFSHSSGAARRL